MVALTYMVAVGLAAQLGRAQRSLVPDFVLPLVPIAAAYLVAHYFTLFLIQGQFIVTLVSDPFGEGWEHDPNLHALVQRRTGRVGDGDVHLLLKATCLELMDRVAEKRIAMAARLKRTWL